MASGKFILASNLKVFKEVITGEHCLIVNLNQDKWISVIKI